MNKFGSVFIIGAGGFAREIESILRMDWDVAYHNVHFLVDPEYLESARKMVNTDGFIDRVRVFGYLENYQDSDCVLAIGDPWVRKKVYDKGAIMLYFPAITAKSVFVGKNVDVGQGFIACQNTVFTCDIKIGKHCYFNSNSVVSHDCRIGDFVTVLAGAKISGNVTIGNRVYIGSNAVIKEGVTICDDVTIGANAFVGKDILEPGTYVGVPAKKMQK